MIICKVKPVDYGSRSDACPAMYNSCPCSWVLGSAASHCNVEILHQHEDFFLLDHPFVEHHAGDGKG